METRTVQSTSLRSATTDDIALRETQSIRLVFRPMLVQNDADATASVKGTFIYQRKGKSQAWEDMPAASLGTVKAGEEYRLALHSSELLKLFNELNGLYELHRKAGIPIGKTKYIRANQTLESLSQLTDDELSGVLSGSESLGASGIARLIQWASSAKNFALLFDRLEALEPDSLRNLNAAMGISELKRALIAWRSNRDTGDEAVWQRLLSSQTFVLEQIFSVPVVVIAEKAYVGGKNISNTGGHIADFLIKNSVSRGVGLIEIKTPKTSILGAEYRSGVYNVSVELTGAIQQILTYRQSLSDERDTLLRGHRDLESFSPRCVVLIGHSRRELDIKEKRQAFELFRGQQSDVEIITFDEMYERTSRLIDLLEGNVQT
jgi:antiviral defense system Shedu protein SduA